MVNDPKPSQTADQLAKSKDSFYNFLSRTGVNPAREDNNLSVGRYGLNPMTRNRLELEKAYRGSWIVGQVIDAYAEDMTRSGISITTNQAAQNVKPLQNYLGKLRIKNSLNSLIKWGRLHGGAIAVLQIKGQNLATPLNLESVGKDQFLGLSVYDRWQLNPDLQNIILEGPDFGLPATYNIISTQQMSSGTNQILGTMGDPTTGQIRVHHSRCIRMIGIELPYNQAITEQMWGESVIERLWDRLISFDDTTLATANLVDRAQLRQIGIEGFRDIVSTGGDALNGLVEMFDMVRRYQTNEGLTLLDKNDVYNTTTYTFTGLAEVLLGFGQQISGASGIPLVRLFGQSPAGLSATGESDIRMYYDNIYSQQEARLRNPIDSLLQVAYRSRFGEAPPDDLEFSFNPLWQMSDVDKANVNKTNTDTIIAAHQEGGISRSTMMKELRTMSGDNGLFGNITDEDIAQAKADEDEPPMPASEAAETALAPAENQEPTPPGPAVKSIDHQSGFWNRLLRSKK